jgi:L-lactate dehydrogenase complex protein LldF
MQVASVRFKQRARAGLENPVLRNALLKARGKFVDTRRKAFDELGNLEALRAAAAAVRDHALAHLDTYLTRFEAEVREAGGEVLWAQTAEDVQRLLRDICARHGVRRAVKSKSMVTEECEVNGALEAAGIEVVETDLGEYILQLAHEPPSHIVAPVVHKTKEEVATLFEQKHGRPRQHDIAALCREAREVLRPTFLAADLGITGANFAVAETGSALIVTNEGNGRLATTLPRVHVAVTGIEKVVPTLEDAALLLRLLTRSATGQPITNYVSLLTGPKRAGDPDGPEHFYVILVDNGRSKLLGGELQPMLRCIRCGACMNHCPVYQNVGGHAYGWVYPGPMGAVLTPSLVGLEHARDLPDASTLCGACAAVCPVNIPLPDLLRALRVRRMQRRLRPRTERAALKLWAWLAAHPRLYSAATRIAARLLHRLGGKEKLLHRLPLASGWTDGRDFPAPAGKTFRELCHRERQL